ncbi:hypothetical protein ACQ3G6_06785 [Allorhizobium undicola]|uniref:hypothetical protein n=1 Tax=Allorhizobium undicola TaxID=78527 RepID=UPI003D33E3B2
MSCLLKTFDHQAWKIRHLAEKASKYHLDRASGKLVLGRVELPFPRSRTGRIAVGSLLILGGVLGFLPVLGFWMVPLGVIVLSHDLHGVRRFRRRVALKWGRWRQRRRERADQAK